MTPRVLIAGHGVAGAVLAHTLLRRGCHVVVADAGTRPAASRVAAGIVNPLTGRKLVRTWRADDLFPFLHRFYTDAQAQLGGQFFHPLDIYRPFRSGQERSDYLALVADPAVAHYVAPATNNAHYAPYIHNSFGGLTVQQAGWLDINAFLARSQAYLTAQHRYVACNVVAPASDPGNVVETNAVATPGVATSGVATPGGPASGDALSEAFSLRADGLTWRGQAFHYVIFCDGPYAQQNPLFGWLPFNPVKGQILTVETAEPYPIRNVVNQGVFILPITDRLLRIGATYTWHDLDWQTTDDGRQFLQTKVAPVLRVPYRVVDQQAGIRPSTKDRRPFVGWHPAHPAVGIFGGLGTKGVSLAPFLAAQLADHLLTGKELDPEVNIRRCVSL